MSGKTKIVVFRMKELIYTVLFIVLAIVLILLLVFMFGPGKDKKEKQTAAYTAGVYTSIQFQGKTIDVQVVVDEDHINSVSFVNLDETVATMYPLMQVSMDDISKQICKKQTLRDITYSDENQYTASLLLGAVDQALEKAKTEED